MRKILLIAGVGVLGWAGAASATPIVANFGFQRPDLGTGSGAYGYRETLASQGGTGWDFIQGAGTSNGAGIAGNGSAFATQGADTASDPATGGVTNAANGQAGLIQGPGTFSQAISGFDGTSYTLSFISEGRNGQSGGNPFTVTLGGTTLTFTPGASANTGTNPSSTLAADDATITPIRGNNFFTYVSNSFTPASGTSPVLAFQGVGVTGKDVTSFIDNVQFNPVPEPTSIGLLGLGGLGLLARRRRIA